MPIFMDRHDIQGVTAEAVAALHQEDLKVQSKYACRVLTYWFDEQRGTGFCLIEAPSPTAVGTMHRQAHGHVPNVVTEVDPSTVLSFLGRIADPEGAAGKPIREAGFRAIMFTDMANSTEITNALGDAGALAVLTTHNKIIRETLLAHEGREIDRAGDGFLASFASASQAVGCAVAIQRALQNYNASGAGAVPIQVRIGLGAGEPLAEGEALFGSTVNLAARICGSAEPGQVLASRVIPELCSGKRFGFRRLSEVSLKGFANPVELYVVDWTG